MSTRDLTVRRGDGSTAPVSLETQHIANCGMAARDPESDRVTELFDELAAIGVTQPDELPTFVSKRVKLLTTGIGLTINTTTTGRELEFVLLPITDQTYVGVCVGHRDDQHTNQDLYCVHSFCLGVLTDEVWPLDELPDYWDKPHCLVGLGLEASTHSTNGTRLTRIPSQKTYLRRSIRRQPSRSSEPQCGRGPSQLVLTQLSTPTKRWLYELLCDGTIRSATEFPSLTPVQSLAQRLGDYV